MGCMRKQAAVDFIFKRASVRREEPVLEQGQGFAPVNIALSKYWGKRDAELNLPLNSSVSLSLKLGAKTVLSQNCSKTDQTDLLRINGQALPANSESRRRLVAFLDLFRPYPAFYFNLESESEVPIAAGFASSAGGYAALVLALNHWFGWNLAVEDLSVLARLGSGSACRSLYAGFSLWKKGEDDVLGLDSFAQDLDIVWPDLKLALCVINEGKKQLDSRTAMQHCVNTSPLFSAWVEHCEKDCHNIVKALERKNFKQLGEEVEANALMMHAVMQAARPAIFYSQPETLAVIRSIGALRAQGLNVYFTQDAGPNIKLLFLEADRAAVWAALGTRSLVSCN